MRKFYIRFNCEIVPCYQIKEGYIPCRDYFKNKSHPYYTYFTRERFCLDGIKASDVYSKETLYLAKLETSAAIESKFADGIKNCWYQRDHLIKKVADIK